MPSLPDSSLSGERIRHPLLKELYEYWKGLGASGGTPLKSRFDPVDLRAALWPRLHMIEIPEDGDVARNRVLGTYVVAAVGLDFTGKRLSDSDIPGMTSSVTYALLQRLMVTGEPQHYFGPPNFGATGRFATHEQVLLPLSDEAGRIVGAVGALDYPGFTPVLFDHKAD